MNATETRTPKPRVLVAIANHGTRNRAFLDRLLAEYRSMAGYALDIVVHSNIPKELGPDIEVRVGLPSPDPWSLPFAHKTLFAERSGDYDLFIYTEDDTLLTERNIDAFVEATRILPEDCIAGFMRYEVDANGAKFYSSIHSHYHWDMHSVVRHGDSIFACHSNEHAACFILTRDQLRRAIASGGFLLPPEKRGYGMPETAATDVYAHCGMKKLICISRFEDFCLHHLPNIYCGKLGLAAELARLEIGKLTSFADTEPPPGPLFTAFRLRDEDRWNKSYYEGRRADVLAAIPADARRVLSVGCNWGATEAELVKRGIEVTAVPLDPVIAAVAAAEGIGILPADFQLAAEALKGQGFDCIIVLDILQHLGDPAAILGLFREYLTESGVLLVSVPNWNHCGTWKQRVTPKGRRALERRALRGRPGVHRTTGGRVRGWLRSAGFSGILQFGAPEARFDRFSGTFPRLAKTLLCRRLLFAARR